MLVLSRKVGERILVPDRGLTVTVVAIEGNQVRLGITAPAEVAVYREEVWDRLAEQTPASGRGGRDGSGEAGP